MSRYEPDEADVRKRVDHGRSRARAAPYNFSEDEHLAADGVAMHQKLSERIERTDGVFCCYLCGDEIFEPAGWHLDHVTPLILRGPHIVDNLEAACDVCNLRKGDLALDKFLTPTEYAEFMAGGGLPPFRAMRERPTAELWARSPKVARRFARRPREVRCVPWDSWFDPHGHRSRVDARIAEVLQARPRSEWHKAMSVQDLHGPMGFKNDHNLTDNYWLRAMGLNDRPRMEPYHDNRLYPSPLVMPVQFGKRARYKGFKLRSSSLHSSVLPDLLLDSGPRRWRDQDEFAVFT